MTTGTATLTDFILARIAEDEAEAQSVLAECEAICLPRLPDDPARQPEREHYRGLAVTRLATLR